MQLFNQNKNETVRMCFNIAGEQLLEKLAEATGLRASAWNVSCSNSNMAHINLRKAAEIFSSIGKFEASAQCFYESEDYELAGRHLCSISYSSMCFCCNFFAMLLHDYFPI